VKKDVKKQEDNSKGKKIARAQFSGTLEVGDSSLPCYVLEDGRRVFSTRGMLEGLGFASNANPNGVFNSKALMPYMLAHNSPYDSGNVIEFITDAGLRAKGYDVEKFMDTCHAISEALDSGKLTGRNEIAGLQANAIIRASSKIGIIALVDEATGYQYVRAEDALQFKLKVYLAEEMRSWEKTFPDELWIEFARLTQWDGQPKRNRPRYWGYLVMDLIYRYLDPDIAQYIKDHKPKPRKGQNYHQWFNADTGMKRLVEHINRVIGMAQGCDTMDELKKKMHNRYGGVPIQLDFFADLASESAEKPLKIKGNFDDVMSKVSKVKPSEK